MKHSIHFAGAVTALIVIETVKLAYEATAYVAEVLYYGIRHNDWYL